MGNALIAVQRQLTAWLVVDAVIRLYFAKLVAMRLAMKVVKTIEGNVTNKEIAQIIFGLIVIIALLAYAGRIDAKDQEIAQAHKNEVLRLAKEEATERKREYNRLAFETYLKTNIKGEMK